MKTERKTISPGKRLRHRCEAAGLHALAWLVPLFPRRFVQRVGRALGSLAYWLSPTLRRVSLENLNVAFGDTMAPAQKRRTARVSVRNVAATLLALFWAPRLTRETLDQFAEVDATSLANVRALKARRKPIIFITLHYGDWELLGLGAGFSGIPFTIVQETMKNEALGEIFARLRGLSGHRLVPSRFAATTLLKTLKRGGNIALLIDLNATRKRGGMWIDFFGLPVFSLAATGALALHADAAIVPSVAYPLPGGRARLVYGPEMEWKRSGDDAADAHAINQQCLAFCEDVIRRHPEFWMWSYKRWTPRATPDQARYPAYSRYMADVAP